MTKRALSVEMRNGIVWFERQPGVTSVIQGRYNSTRHKHAPGFVRVHSANEKNVHVLLYDKNGMKDLYVYAPPSPTRDKWVALVASGQPFDGNGAPAVAAPAVMKLRDTIKTVVGEAARTIWKPVEAIVNQSAAQLFDVTPELAARWLEHNTRNRKLRQSVVNRYAADMKAGRWMVTGDAIAFDRNGAIINGQHRLWAVLEANITVQMLVVFDLEPDTVAVLDDHLKRNLVDVEGIRKPGSTVGSVHAAVAKLLLETSIGLTAVDKRYALQAVTRQQQLDILDTHWLAIEFAYRDCFHSRKMRNVTVASTLTPVARAYYTQDRSRLISFGKVMINGMVESPADQPAILLRNYLLRYAGGKGLRPERDAIYRKTERALAAFLEGTKLSNLFEASTELFPLPNEHKPATAPKPLTLKK